MMSGVFRAESLTGEERVAGAARRCEEGLRLRCEEVGARFGAPVFLRAFKRERELEVWIEPAPGRGFVLLRRYPIVGASGSLGPKLAEGDGQVPEGCYAFGWRQLKPDSAYHLAFNIGYPNFYDVHHGRTGSFIMVHGGRQSIGCLAMTDEKIEEIYLVCEAALRGGQEFIRIHVFPFRMEGGALEEFGGHRWYGFWENLQEGYAAFERDRRPPDAQLKDGRYDFTADPPDGLGSLPD